MGVLQLDARYVAAGDRLVPQLLQELRIGKRFGCRAPLHRLDIEGEHPSCRRVDEHDALLCVRQDDAVGHA